MVPEMWKRQYPIDRKTAGCDSTHAVYQKLMGGLSEVEINKLIGNDGWTANRCEECGEDSQVLIIFEHNDESVRVCKSCLEKALKLIV